jgi:hypothetical protein
VSYGSDLQAEVRALIDEANCLRATVVRKRDIRTALKGIDTALKALEVFAPHLLAATGTTIEGGDPASSEHAAV